MAEVGVRRRLDRILGEGACIVLPLDGGLIDGPMGALEETERLLRNNRLLEGVDAILGFRGLLKTNEAFLRSTPFIMNLSGSTTLATHTLKTKVAAVESAV